MTSVNRVILIGSLGRDPELRHLASGAAICTLRLATARKWRDKTSGEWAEETEWHSVVLFERLAEVAGEYLKKGRQVYIEGRLKTRKWQDKEGQDRYTTEVLADSMQLLGSRDDGEQGAGARPAAPRPAAPAAAPASGDRRGPPPGRSAAPAARPAPPSRSGTAFDDMTDDIPF